MRFFKLFLFSLILFFSSTLFKIFNETTKYHKLAIANIEQDIKNLEFLPLKSDSPNSYIGTSRDSYFYLRHAYSIYLNSKPYNCYRPQTGYIYYPFLILFNKFFLIAILLFNSVIFSFCLTYLIWTINNKSLLKSIFIIIFVFIMTYHNVPMVLLEPIASSLLMLSLSFYFKKQNYFSILSLFLGSLIRGEIMLIFLLFTIFLLILRNFKQFIFSFILLSIIMIFYSLLNKCTDQSNFYYWALVSYYVHKNHLTYEKSREIIMNMCKIKNLGELFNCMSCYKCFKENLINEIKSDPKISLKLAFKNFIYNMMKILILPTEKYKGKFKNYLILFFSIIHLIWFFLFLISIPKSDKFIILLFLSLVIFYNLFFIFGGFDFSRFKIMILPFEIYFVLKTLSDNQFQLYKCFPFFHQK